MQLFGPSMTPYTVTEEDVLWLLRAVEAEGPIESEVAATLLNGFCFVRSKRYRGTLTAFLRAYAQPINPRWFITGDKHLSDLRGKSPPAVRAAEQLALERERTHVTRTVFQENTEKSVVAALHGFVRIPPNATDYAAPFLDATAKRYTPLATAVQGRNRLWVRPNALSWTGYRVDPLTVKPWLVALSEVRLENALDRAFTDELTKVAQFFQDNAATYANAPRQMTLGEARVPIGEASDYSSVYTVALAQRAVNERLSAHARAQQMYASTRADDFQAGKAFNQARADAWAQRAANLRRITSASAAYPVLINAVGFDFATGSWTVTSHGKKI